MNTAKAAAYQLADELDGAFDFAGLRTYCERNGYVVILSNTTNGDMLLQELGIYDSSANRPSCYHVDGKSKYMIVSGSLSDENRVNALLEALWNVKFQPVAKSCGLKTNSANEFIFAVRGITKHKLRMYRILHNKAYVATAIICMLLLISVPTALTWGKPSQNAEHIAPQSAPTTPTLQQSAPAERTEPETVYVTPTGECYHREGCGYLRNGSIAVSINQAKQSYRPCAYCMGQ